MFPTIFKLLVLIVFLINVKFSRQQRFFSLPGGAKRVSVFSLKPPRNSFPEGTAKKTDETLVSDNSENSRGVVNEHSHRFQHFPAVEESPGAVGRPNSPVVQGHLKLNAKNNLEKQTNQNEENVVTVHPATLHKSTNFGRKEFSEKTVPLRSSTPEVFQRGTSHDSTKVSVVNAIPEDLSLTSVKPLNAPPTQPPQEAYIPSCPDSEFDYLIPHPTQCDAFFLCQGGRVQSRLCPDGLIFSISLAKCSLPTSGDCDGRPDLQPASGTGLCPRRNGIFHSSQSCTKFVKCKYDQPLKGTCAEGLVFDSEKKICAWADEALRPGCLPSDLLNFRCPNPILTQKEAIEAGVHLPFGDHGRHEDRTDCRFYFICLTTGHPRRAGCGDGLVYSPRTSRCTDPKEVAGCENYYS